MSSVHEITTLDELFLDELSDVHDAERRFLEAQRAMLARATAPPLRAMIDAHIAESEGQLDILKLVFAALEAKPRRIKCDAAEGLVAEGEKMMKQARRNPYVLDCAIATAICKVEHYEVASYRGLVAAAKVMERDDLVELLLSILEQEEETATKVEQAKPGLIRKAMSEVVES